MQPASRSLTKRIQMCELMPAPRRAFTGCSDRIVPICVHAWQRQHNGGDYGDTTMYVRYTEHEDGGPALMWSGYVEKTVHMDFHFYNREPPLLSRGNAVSVEWYRTVDYFRRDGLCRSYLNVSFGASNSKRCRTNTVDQQTRTRIYLFLHGTEDIDNYNI